MRKYFALVISLFVLSQAASIRACGGPPPPADPNGLQLQARDWVTNNSYPYNQYAAALVTSFAGEVVSELAGVTGTNNTASGDTTDAAPYLYAAAFFSQSRLPANWRFKVTAYDKECYTLWGPTKAVPPAGAYTFTCPVSIQNGQIINWSSPTASTIDATGDLVLDPNNIGEGLSDGNAFMFAGDGLLSANSQYTLMYMSDGNLAEFDSTYRMVWLSWTSGSGGGDAHVHLQDGNLVIYNSGTSPVFVTGTGNHPGAYLLCQNDGNIVIYASDGTPLWGSGVP